jgi:hypothetical protein
MSARILPTPAARPAAAAPAVATKAAARFDRRFIEEHQLLERYLDGKLPVKGARELESWCRDHPEYVQELKLSERAQSSLKLLEACGKPVDLSEPRTPWWRSVYLPIVLAIAAFSSLAGLWVLTGKYAALQTRLEEARAVQTRGTLVQPTSETSVTIVPDRSSDIGHARILVSHEVPQLIDVHIDLAYTQPNAPGTSNALAKKVMTFRLVVDKKDQGRALIVNNLLKDSNNQLRLTLNTTGLAAGIYTVRIEGVPFGGGSYAVGWMLLEVK